MAEFALNRTVAGSVALTFDDGPSPWTPMALSRLADAGARATFFVSLPSEPDLVQRIAAAGHEVGYHCGMHVRHSRRTRLAVEREVRRDLTSLERLDICPRVWRTPWGDLAPWSAELADELGLQLWGWSDDTEDWSGRRTDAMLADLESSVAPGAVVLMHDGIGPGARRADCLQTIELIAPLVELCRSRGLEPAPISTAPALL